jgi:hypothetical protein
VTTRLAPSEPDNDVFGVAHSRSHRARSAACGLAKKCEAGSGQARDKYGSAPGLQTADPWRTGRTDAVETAVIAWIETGDESYVLDGNHEPG